MTLAPPSPSSRPPAPRSGAVATDRAEPDRSARSPGAVARVGLVLLVTAAVLVHTVTEDQVLYDGTYLGVLAVASAGAWWGAVRASPEDRWVARLIAVGVTFSAVADAVWTLLDHLGAETDVSVADLGWAASYVALAAAIWIVLAQERTPGRTDFDTVVDVLTIVVVGVVLLWRTSLEGIVADTYDSALSRVVVLAYPVADAVLLALVVRALLTRRSRARLGWCFGAGVTLWFAADLGYVYWPDSGAVADLKDAAWMVGPVLLACAAWPSRAPTPARATLAEPPVAVAQLLLAVGPLLVPPVLEVGADMAGRPDRPGELFLSMAALVVLAFVRTARLLASEQRAQLELEQARDAALEASEAKSLFLANMGHEIRTPLTTVLAVAELLEDTTLDPEQQALLARMQRSGELLRDLVERVLDYSKLVGGEMVLRPTELDPSALVSDVVAAYEGRAGLQGLEVSSYVDPDTPATMTADLVRVFQVLTNLMDNAFKFTARGSVRLEVRPGEGRPDLVRFLVVDTGIGIRDEDQSLVFDLFKQVDGTMTRSYGGSGLGLAICQVLANAMGGTVSVTSRPDEGSCFELVLPVVPVPAHADEQPSPDQSTHPR